MQDYATIFFFFLLKKLIICKLVHLHKKTCILFFHTVVIWEVRLIENWAHIYAQTSKMLNVMFRAIVKFKAHNIVNWCSTS